MKTTWPDNYHRSRRRLLFEQPLTWKLSETLTNLSDLSEKTPTQFLRYQQRHLYLLQDDSSVIFHSRRQHSLLQNIDAYKTLLQSLSRDRWTGQWNIAILSLRLSFDRGTKGGSKKSAENGFMTGGGCNSSSNRVGRQTWTRLSLFAWFKVQAVE